MDALLATAEVADEVGADDATWRWWPFWWLCCCGKLLAVDEAAFRLLLDTETGAGCDPAVFFHGWKPLPTAASASGGGLLDDNLLHCAANMANGVPLRPGCSCFHRKKNHSLKPCHQF